MLQMTTSDSSESSLLSQALKTAEYEKDNRLAIFTWIVTVRLPKNPEHDPTNKKMGKCPFSEHCTDVTGEHHSFLTSGYTEEEVRELFKVYHITRVEKV